MGNANSADQKYAREAAIKYANIINVPAATIEAFAMDVLVTVPADVKGSQLTQLLKSAANRHRVKLKLMEEHAQGFATEIWCERHGVSANDMIAVADTLQAVQRVSERFDRIAQMLGDDQKNNNM